jgi:methanogenic corrinoid protein MtbC1
MARNWPDELMKTIYDADRALANELIDAWAVEHGFESAVTDYLCPVLEAFGEAWACQIEAAQASLAQGYVAAKIAEDALAKVLTSREPDGTAPRKPTKGPVILGNVEDDYHPLGRKMVGSFLRLAGWDVRDLGVDVEASAFVDAAVAAKARVVGVSAMMLSTARNLRKLREEIDRRGLCGRLQLAVGGAVFKLRPELVEELGGDGCALTALQASSLFDRLWRRSCELGPEPGAER